MRSKLGLFAIFCGLFFPFQKTVLSQQETNDELKVKVKRALEDALECLPESFQRMVSKRRNVVEIEDWEIRGKYADVHFKVQAPWMEDAVRFVARNMRYEAHEGDHPNYRLEFSSDYTKQLSEELEVYIPGHNENSVEWDCEGYSMINLNGAFKFIGDNIYSASPYSDQVMAEFSFQGADMEEFVVDLDVTPFHITGNEGTVYVVQDAKFDWSGTRNPDGLPEIYDGDGNAIVSGNEWRGLYLQNVNVYVANKRKGDVELIGTTYRLQNLVVDSTGVSGRIDAENLLKARGDNWGFVFDRFQLIMIRNQIRGLTVDMGVLSDGKFRFSIGYKP